MDGYTTSLVYTQTSTLARAQETAVAGESGDGEAALPMLSVVNTMLMRKTEVGYICFRRMLRFGVLPF